MAWIDTHAHLDAPELAHDVDAVREQARAQGVVHCVLPAVERSNWDSVRLLAHRHSDSYALGIHPLYTGRAQDEDLELLAHTLQQHRADPRLVHVSNLAALLARGRLHAPLHVPDDGHPYRTIHDTEVQANRRIKEVPCGPGGTVHDYLPFYFGPLSVMLLKLKSGQVEGYAEGQEPLVYLRTTVQAVMRAGCPFVFTDGHGLAKFTRWFDEPAHLDAIDWPLVRDRFWADTF